MKEYPFSGMRPEQALELLWQEFNAYKNSTNKQITLLQEEINSLKRNQNSLELNTMLSETTEVKENPYIKEI